MQTVAASAFLDELLHDSPTTGNTAAAGHQMHIVIKKFLLEAILDKAATVVSSRGDVMPVLRYFQFNATPGKLKVTASDMELSVIATTEIVDIQVPGVVVLPVKRLVGIVREAAGDDVAIHVKGIAAAITVGNTTWNLQLEETGDDFPDMKIDGEGSFATIGRVTFLSALSTVRYAASKDTTRTSLMLINCRAGKLTACDGARFQLVTVPDLPLTLQIPIGAVDTLIKLLRHTALDEIAVGDTPSSLVFRLGTDVLLVKKLLIPFVDQEAQYLQPALANKHSLSVDREALIAAIRRVRINADRETAAIALRLAPGTLTVIARDAYNNDAAETIPAGWAGPERTIVANHAYLADLVTRYDGKSCEFKLGDDTKTRRTNILLRDETTGSAGVVQQMNVDWYA